METTTFTKKISSKYLNQKININFKEVKFIDDLDITKKVVKTYIYVDNKWILHSVNALLIKPVVNPIVDINNNNNNNNNNN